MSGRRTAAAALLGLALTLSPGCGDETQAKDPDTEPAQITGFTLEAATGEPLAGVSIEGPRELRAESDEAGRFALHGLEVGESGVLRAHHPDGLAGELPFTALEAGAREVVFHLTDAPTGDAE